MRSRLLVILIALIVLPTLAQAQVQGRHSTWRLGTLLTAVAMNGAAGTRTFTFTNPSGGFARARFSMARTRVASTDMTMTCTRTDSSGVVSKVQTCAFGTGDGICTHVDVTWLDETDGTETVTWELEMLGFYAGTCVVAMTAAGATDLLTVTGDLVTQ